MPIETVMNYDYYDILLNMLLALGSGFWLSCIYRYTHKGLSYSQSFTQTIVYIAVIIAVVIMAIGSSLPTAFALVGALSIIRFRTVIKDTKDISYIFASLAVGLAAGTSHYFIAISGTLFVTVIGVIMHKANYGALYKSEFILRFRYNQDFSSDAYLEKIQEFAKRSNLLHIEPADEGKSLHLTYDINLKEGKTADEFSKEMGQLEGSSEIVLIASKNDVDY
ncbi:MAG: DUF4956 domain-containing protein [Planctomycetes bacterium]|nr:DUF4956 domain-containing protein [Planctomycetota bacterium]